MRPGLVAMGAAEVVGAVEVADMVAVDMEEDVVVVAATVRKNFFWLLFIGFTGQKCQSFFSH